MKKFALYLSLLLCSTLLMAQPDISIVEAAANGDLEKVEAHLTFGTDINNRYGEKESTALHAAAYHGNLEIVKFLIEKGAEINARNKHGQTPRDVAWDDMENERFSDSKKESKRKAGEFIKNKGGEHGKARGGSALRFLGFLPCLIPIFLVLGIIYAIKTKPVEHAMPTPTKKMLVVTSPTIPGKKVVRVLGLVRGNTIRARHVGKDILAGLRNIVGGEVTEYAKLLAESREQAIDRMLVEAEGLGANAVISVDFQTSVIMGGAAEMMAYGTAVVVEEEES